MPIDTYIYYFFMLHFTHFRYTDNIVPRCVRACIRGVCDVRVSAAAA